MLQNAYSLAKIGADTAENERDFAEIIPKIGNYPTSPSSCSPAPQLQPGPSPGGTPEERVIREREYVFAGAVLMMGDGVVGIG